MKCETNIEYTKLDKAETKSQYLCGRTAIATVSYANEGESVSNQPICKTHLAVLQKKPFEIVVTDVQ